MLPKNPNHDAKRNSNRRDHSNYDENEKQPVASIAGPGIFLFANKQTIVATVGFPENVEEVTDHWNCAERRFQEHISDHASESDGGNAAAPGREDDEERSAGGKGITDAWNPADDRVKAKADVRAGNAEHVVEKRGDVVEVLIRSILAEHWSGSIVHRAE